VQSKKRAYFEYLLPRAYDTEARDDFLDAINDDKAKVDGNDTAFEMSVVGVTMRYSTPDAGDVIDTSQQNPPASKKMPMEVGVKSPIAALLPFLRDEVLVKGHDTRANNLSMFCRDHDADNIPLLKYHETIIVGLKAKHYWQYTLDALVYGWAQEAGMEVKFPGRECREAALKELSDCGLPTAGLKSFPSSML
jgi:hypothetical protein